VPLESQVQSTSSLMSVSEVLSQLSVHSHSHSVR